MAARLGLNGEPRIASYTRIQFNRISTSVLVPTITHRVRPCSSGRTPTFLSVSLFRPAPIKNSVTVRPSLPRWFSAPNAGLNRGNTLLTNPTPQNNITTHAPPLRPLLFTPPPPPR